MRPGRTSRTRQGVAPGVRSQIFEPLFSNQIWLGTKAMSKTLSGLVRSFPKFQTVAQTQGIRILTYWSVALFFDFLVQLGAVEDTAKWLRYIMWFIIYRYALVRWYVALRLVSNVVRTPVQNCTINAVTWTFIWMKCSFGDAVGRQGQTWFQHPSKAWLASQAAECCSRAVHA